ncbi:MAG: T9SS type A sorting domain-containing protein [Bacteroidales bacterium]|nr:T9SS type A sorting domain-containing protein [Bacteroidales bacterium]
MRKFLVLLFVALFYSGFSEPVDSNFLRRMPMPPKNLSKVPVVRARSGENMMLTNLVVFIRFADDEEFTTSLDYVDQMFNDSSFQAVSVYNYFNVMTYGKINYRSIFPNNCQNSTIVSYKDIYPRWYFQPQSPSNPGGYPPQSTLYTNDRERKLLVRVLSHIDSAGLIDESVSLDGNGDGYIDNISFVIKGDVGNWGDLLWPHMDFFSSEYAGLSYTLTVNGKIPLAYNFEFADSGPNFSANTFAHEMGHSLGLPDLYHYYYYNNVYPVGIWDQMGQNNLQQVSTILKYKHLGVVEEPIEITEDGHYVLNSNTSADHHNCYFIRSSVDPDQWFTFEYRNCDDFMDNVPASGLIIGRWTDFVDPSDMHESGNGGFDFHNKPHSYWVFRPNSQSDTVNGNLYRAVFSSASGRTSFGPGTNPRPYLVYGEFENSFEITNIYEFGNTLSFDVRFLDVGVESHAGGNSIVYPNPTSDFLNISAANLMSFEIFDMLGRKVVSGGCDDGRVDVSSLKDGLYVVKVSTSDGCFTEKFVKR